MYNVVDFEQAHIFDIKTNFEFTDYARQAFGNHQVVAGFTICEQEEIIACGGVHIMWEGVGEAWLVLSKEAYKSPISVARYTYQLFDTIMNENELWRVQASVHTDDDESVRFAEWLGFEDEGLMKKFGPDGADYIRMARVV